MLTSFMHKPIVAPEQRDRAAAERESELTEKERQLAARERALDERQRAVEMAEADLREPAASRIPDAATKPAIPRSNRARRTSWCLRLAKHRYRFLKRYYHLTKRRFPPGRRRYAFEVFTPIARLAQASLVDALELRRPVLRQEIQLPIQRHDHQDLALADDSNVLPALRTQANFVADRFHRDGELLRDLQRVRQHGEGGGW
jgi:hypothetical protein